MRWLDEHSYVLIKLIRNPAPISSLFPLLSPSLSTPALQANMTVYSDFGYYA